jgi:small conductance mechanosensitive channel
MLAALGRGAFAQETAPSVAPKTATSEAEPEGPTAPEKVDVQPPARDLEIGKRLHDILVATEWFRDVQATVREGVVFVDGIAESEEHRNWVSELARNTEGVVAVVNRMEIEMPSAWDYTPARDEIDALTRGFVRSLPLIVVAFIVMG